MELHSQQPEHAVATALRRTSVSDDKAPIEEFPDDPEHRQELEFYSSPVQPAQTLALCWRFLRLVPACLGFGSEYLYVNLMTSTGLHFASMAFSGPDPTHLSEFSVAVFISSIMIIAITHAIIEKTTIDAALHSANNDLVKLKKVLLEGFVGTMIVFITLFWPIIELCPYWITLLKYEPESGVRIKAYLLKLFWILLVGQSVLYVVAVTGTVVPDSQLPLLTVLNLLTAVATTYWFCWYNPGGLEGWFQAYLVHQAVRVGIYLPYCFKQFKELNIISRYAEWPDLAPIAYLRESAWFIVGVYTEQIALEIATFLVILTGDRSQIAAEVAFVTMTYFVYNIGLGFSQVARSRFGYLHEKGASMKPALRFFCNFLVGMLCISGVAGFLLQRYTQELQRFFAESKPEVSRHLASLIKLYSFTLFSDFVVNLLFCALRVINKLEVATLGNMFGMLVLQSGTGLVLVLLLHKDASWVMGNFYFIQIGLLALALIVIVSHRRSQVVDTHRHYEALQ